MKSMLAENRVKPIVRAVCEFVTEAESGERFGQFNEFVKAVRLGDSIDVAGLVADSDVIRRAESEFRVFLEEKGFDFGVEAGRGGVRDEFGLHVVGRAFGYLVKYVAKEVRA